MAGTLTLLGSTSAAAITDTETINRDDAVSGCARSMVVIADIVTITGTWTIAINKRIGSGIVPIATAAHTTVGRKIIPLTADFNGKDANTPNAAILLPDQIVFTEDIAGTLTADVHIAAA